ncbi:MAG: cytochrome P450 [Pseudonocardia sp.]
MQPHSFPFPRASCLELEPEYGLLQREEPVSRVAFPHGDEAWLVTRYADVRTVLADPRFSRAVSLERDVPRVTVENFSGGIVAMDPPDHTRVRAVCRHAFTTRTVARLRERAASIADELLEEAMGAGSFDGVEDFAVPYTLKMICELLGVPYDDRHRFRRWAEAGLATTAISEDERWQATGHMWDYVAGLVAARRRSPRDDLISSMVGAQAETGSVTDDELVIVVMTILVAGFETTSTQLPNFVHVLLEDPARFRCLVEEQSIIPCAVEELMRYVPLEANGASPRYALEDVVLSGTRITAGSPVVAATVIANRDPEVFADPHRLDLRRTPNPHIGFGVGAHFCLGAPLARLELQVALEVLTTVVPGLELSQERAAVEWKAGMLLRGPSRLTLTAPARRTGVPSRSAQAGTEDVVTSREPPPVERFRPADLEQDWATLRSTCPVSRTATADGTGVWLVSRHQDIKAVLNGSVFSVSPVDLERGSGTAEANESIFQDPPEHTRLRGLVAAPFAVGQVGRYREAIRAKADELVATMASGNGPVDIMEQFAKPLTMNAISDVVGVPVADRPMFQRLSDQLLVPLSEAQGVVALGGWRQLNDYVIALIAQRRRAAGDQGTDLLAHLIRAQHTDATLTDVELTTMVLGLPVAGYVSTANAIAVAVRHLLTDGWLDELRTSSEGSELATLFVEEVLRIQSGDNGESMPRFASEDVRLGGATICKGDMVVAPLVAANRDEELFAQPETFDPRRPRLVRHLAFGFGIHRCLGANLARLELQCAVRALVESGVDLELVDRWESVPWRVNMLGDRFPERLLVSATAAARSGGA